MKLTNKLNLPQAIYRAIANDPYVLVGDISVTGVIDPLQKRALSVRYKDLITEDISDRIWPLMGNNTHYIIEKAESEDSLQEHRWVTDILGWKVSGQTDIYEDRMVTDIKTTSVWSIMHGVKPEWVQQLNAYAYLWRENDFTVNGLQVIAILRDWSKHGHKRSRDYPKSQAVVVPIPLWDHLTTRKWLEGRVKLHQESEDLKDELLPHCTPKERWEKPTTWRVIKEGRKSAVRVLNSEGEAKKYIDDNQPKGKISIVCRPGESTMCESYCSVNTFCHQYQRMNVNLFKGGQNG